MFWAFFYTFESMSISLNVKAASERCRRCLNSLNTDPGLPWPIASSVNRLILRLICDYLISKINIDKAIKHNNDEDDFHFTTGTVPWHDINEPHIFRILPNIKESHINQHRPYLRSCNNEAKVNSVICAAISWNQSNSSLIQRVPSITQGTNIYWAGILFKVQC